MERQLYSLKSNARRAARKAGLDPDVVVQPDYEGNWYIADAETVINVQKGQADAAETFPNVADATPKPASDPNPIPFDPFAEADALRKEGGLTAMAATLAGSVREDVPYVEPVRAEPKAPKGRKPKAATTPKAKPENPLVAFLERPEGATVAEIMAATNWLPHTTRARISNIGKDRAVKSAKEGERGRVYRFA